MPSLPQAPDAALLRRRAEQAEALRENEERLRLAIDAGQLGIWDWDIEHDHLAWSDRVYQLHDVPAGGFGGRIADFAALIHPDDVPGVEASIQEAVARGRSFAAEFRVRLSNGGIRWLSTRAEVIRNAQGQAVRMVGSTNDVTERVELLTAERRSRAAAEQARRRLELLAAAGSVLSGSLEPKATLQAIASIVVPAIADWCRVDLLDADGVMQRALTHHSDPEKARYGAELAAKLRAAPGTPGSMAWVAAKGEPYLAHFTGTTGLDRIRDGDLLTFAEAIGMTAYFMVPLVARGRTLGALAALQAESGRPISADDCALLSELAQRAALALDNARLYADAESALKEAETANRAKDEFLAMLGHELRNPLAPIVTALHVMQLRDGGSSGDERRIIERQVAHLSRLVDDLLDVSRITKGIIQLEREPVNMKAVVDRAVELTQPALDRRSRAIDLDLADADVFVSGDPLRLVQVVCNLLTNGAKFTPPEGRLGLRLRQVDGVVEVTVEDSGKGIAPELLPRVFDLFVQGEQPMDRRAGGLGLGLAIVKTLVQMHGGTVSAASAGAGQGSAFTVRLPAADGVAAHAVDGVAPEQRASGSGHVLIVDDNVDAAQTLELLLQLEGYSVSTAGDGAGALASLDRFVPDIALLDIGLPGMDGYELALRMRDDSRAKGIKLVALTGYGSERDRARALASQFDEHLVKPVAPELLLDVVRRLLHDRSQSDREARVVTAPADDILGTPCQSSESKSGARPLN